MNSGEFYTIGEISALCHIPLKTLRYYDEIGLLVPSMRSSTNYRYYSNEQILTLYIIKKLKSFGFPLEEIKLMINSRDVKNVTRRLRERSFIIESKIESLEAIQKELGMTLSRLETGISLMQCFDGNEPKNQREADSAVKIEEIPRYNCIFTRQIQKNYDNSKVTSPRWLELFNIVKKLKLKSIGAVLCTYHNEPMGQFVNRECDMELSVPVYGGVNSPYFKVCGGYKAATALHLGSHGTLIATHFKMIKWINSNKMNISGPISEEYIISPLDVTNEDDFVTKVIIPVEMDKI
ncbi:MAG: MerR family transcriptional regulator [Firmicutes bacterium]|nr:MerR family transcriptional regulator [Bacillota bacterium]